MVDNAGDIVSETSTPATEMDSVNSTVSYTLGVNLETLNLTVTAAINGTGNTLNNVITGNAANNTLDGSAGNDILNGGNGNDILVGGFGNDSLTGGSGSDRFLYNTNAAFNTTAVGIDSITDFISGTDQIVLDKTTFSAISSAAGPGFSLPDEFAIVGSDTAALWQSRHNLQQCQWQVILQPKRDSIRFWYGWAVCSVKRNSNYRRDKLYN